MLRIVLLFDVVRNLVGDAEVRRDERISQITLLYREVMPSEVIAQVEPDGSASVKGNSWTGDIHKNLYNRLNLVSKQR